MDIGWTWYSTASAIDFMNFAPEQPTGNDTDRCTSFTENTDPLLSKLWHDKPCTTDLLWSFCEIPF